MFLDNYRQTRQSFKLQICFNFYIFQGSFLASVSVFQFKIIVSPFYVNAFRCKNSVSTLWLKLSNWVQKLKISTIRWKFQNPHLDSKFQYSQVSQFQYLYLRFCHVSEIFSILINDLPGALRLWCSICFKIYQFFSQCRNVYILHEMRSKSNEHISCEITLDPRALLFCAKDLG